MHSIYPVRWHEVVHSILNIDERTQDGSWMDYITSEDPCLGRKTVEAFLSLNQNT